MAKTIYKIELTEEERQLLQKVIDEGKEPDRTILRAKILLMSDALWNEKYTVLGLAKELGTTDKTVQTTRTEYGKYGLKAAVFPKKRVYKNGSNNKGPNKKGAHKFKADVVSQIVQLSESEPPEGKKRWTMRLLCEECEKQGIVDHIAPSSLCGLLKKAGISLKGE
jgi:transposase